MVAVATGAGWLLQDLLDLSNVALVFVLPVLAAALAWGLGPALVAAGLSVLAYNFFFTVPLYTFHISDPRTSPGSSCSRSWPSLASGIAARTRAQTLVARQEAARVGGALRLRQEAHRRGGRSTTCCGPPPTRSR